MQHDGSKYCILSRCALIIAGLLFAMCTQAENDQASLRGPAFSDPDQRAPISEDWLSRPVQHEAGDEDADLVVGLGQQSWPILHTPIRDYARQHKLKIVVKQGTCGITAGRLLRKSVDIGAYCCPPGQNDRLPGVEFHSLGISPIAIIVHPDNPLTDITTAQAREIFQGSINRWIDLGTPENGGLDRLVQPVGRLHCKIRPGHWRLLLKDEDRFSPRLFEVGVIPDMISRVARNHGAVGMEVPSMMRYHAEKGEVRMLNIDGHSPMDLDYVRDGKYPLYRTYHLTTWKQDTPANRRARKLVQFLQQYIEKVHEDISFVPPSALRRAGWVFRGDELVGEPEQRAQAVR